MKLCPRFILSDSFFGDEKKVMARLRRDKLPEAMYYLSLPAGKCGRLIDIRSARELRRSFDRDGQDTVFGLAKSKEEAEMLAARFVYTVYRDTGGFDLSGWLFGKEVRK